MIQSAGSSIQNEVAVMYKTGQATELLRLHCIIQRVHIFKF